MRISASGIAIEYDVSGSVMAPVVTFCHALAANRSAWAPQAAALESRYRVLKLDARGHGGSDIPPPPYTFAQMVADVCSLLDDLGVQRTHFVGISMGGMIGQWLALTHPERLRSLVLADTCGRTPAEAHQTWDERMALAEREGMEPHVETTIGRWFTPRFVEEHPEIVDTVRAMIRGTDPRGFIGCASAVKKHDALDRLAEIMVPTLVIVGEEDPGTPVGAAQALHERIAGSELVVLKSASHLSNVEQAKAFTSALEAFLSRTPR